MFVTTSIVNPSQNIIDRESEHILLSFCTTSTLLYGKKLSLQNVFILILENPVLCTMLKQLLGVDSTFEVVKIFLDYDPTITKSKYITKYINSKKNGIN
jgi:hypothetical protein